MRSTNVAVLLACELFGCDQQAMFEKFVPKSEAVFAEGAVAKLAARDFAAVEATLNPALRTPKLRDKFEEIIR